MPIEKYNKYFEALELNQGATQSDVRNAYLYLKALYSNDSIVTSALAYEFSEEKKQSILEEIEDAYARLTEFFESRSDEPVCKEKPSFAGEDEVKEYISGIASFDGASLKQIREKLRVTLKDMAVFTKVRRQYFEDIELERFSALPAEVYLRGYIMEYARYLSLDPVKVADDYMQRYRSDIKAKDKQY